MLKHTALKHTGTLLSAAAAALIVVLTATSSLAAVGGVVKGPQAAGGVVKGPHAAGGVKVSPGGKFTATSGTVTFTDTASHTALSCGSSKGTGVFKKGSQSSGTHIGRINSFAFSKCNGPSGLSLTINGTFPWYINITEINTAKGEATGTSSSISGTVSTTGCSFTVAGTSGNVGGTADIIYTNSTAKLDVIASGSTLHVWNVSGCLGLVNNGDPVAYTADYTVKPPQTIS